MKLFDDLSEEQLGSMHDALTSTMTTDFEKLTRCVVVWLTEEVQERVDEIEKKAAEQKAQLDADLKKVQDRVAAAKAEKDRADAAAADKAARDAAAAADKAAKAATGPASSKSN
jgi:peptidoglycan hydrolase CwlO-like protein